MPAVLIGVAINSCYNLELITASGLLLLILRGWRGKKWAVIIAPASGNDEKTIRVDFKVFTSFNMHRYRLKKVCVCVCAR